MEKGKVALGADHAGFEYKEKVKQVLEELGYEWQDFGAASVESIDYPPVGREVAETVASGKCRWGVLACGAGIGMSIVANRVSGARAALCYSEQVAEITRQHNDANILVLAGRFISWEETERIVRKFFSIDFPDEERHVRRIKMIDGG